MDSSALLPLGRLDLRRAQQLLAISHALATTTPEALLRQIIAEAAALLDAEAASLLLYDPPRRCLRFAAATGADPAVLSRQAVPLEGSLAGTILREARPVRVDGVEGDARHFKGVDAALRFRTRTLLGVPLVAQQQPLGVLQVINRRNGPFDEADEQAAMVLAAHASVALQAAQKLQALRAAHAETAQLDDLKSRFLALASHELRTPLSVILGFGALLREEVAGEQTELVDEVLAAGRRLQEVLEAMTQMHTLRTRADRPQRRACRLQSLLGEAAREVQSAAAAHGHTLSFSGPPSAAAVEADVPQLVLAFVHLLRNAIQFTPDGGRITLRATDEADCVHVTIADTGIGIVPEALEQVFRDFYQVADPLTRTHGGLGVGLTLAREVVQLHEGRLWVESAGPGTGTTAHVVLPTVPLATAVAPAETERRVVA